MSAEKESSSLRNQFGILQVLTDHKEDVRAVSNYPGACVLTGSRDKTVKLYGPADPNNAHSEMDVTRTFRGPENFVSSVCYGKTKSGAIEIYVGAHDMNIHVYTSDNSDPIRTLSRHTGPVCTLAFRICYDEDVLVSGSWDNTALIWRDNLPVATLLGHVNAVWSVAFVARSYILTGGADKTIRKWNVADGQLLNIFDGHTDCVRGLAVINGQQFLSCSNDATVILWTIEGEILKTFDGHENFIYDICIVREPLKPDVEPPKTRPYKFVTVSEDRNVKIWDKDLGCVQTIQLQAKTLWSVAALDNGNFVVGTSQGHSYVFSLVSESEPPAAESSTTTTTAS